MGSPFFSVCVPVYNGQEHLLECLRSISRQTFADFEIIVVDDQSTDGSFELVREYAKDERRLRFFRNETNLGLVENWNACLSIATGKWIKFLFQDDYWQPECLQEVFNVAENSSFVFHGRDFAYSSNADTSLREFYESSILTNQRILSDSKSFSEEEICRLISLMPGYNFFGEPSNVAFRSDLINSVGLFDKRLAQLCDYEFWCRATTNVGAYYLNQNLSTFRVHGKSASSANLSGRTLRYRYLDKLIVLFEFCNNLLYRNLRLHARTVSPSHYEVLYKQQVANISLQFAKCSRHQRTIWKREARLYAEFLSATMSELHWTFIRNRISLNVRKLWHVFR